MAYEALARKYRPRTFEEVVGQRPIVRTLTNAIRTGRIHHAYVFSGVRGVGKTTVARILAKALNCEKGPTPTPCLVCDPCVEIAAGRDLDVIEMDAASRTGVDDVRELIDTTRYAPARDRYKVFIIDEFHMLSKPAFNALLKTLEEPPPRIVFVMATTELHKVLPTVLSRTQQFDFRKVGIGEIADQLGRIAEAEKIEAPRACLEMLARAGDGSVRDAESLLDQAIATSGAELNEEDLRALLGLVPDETVEAFLTACAERDAAGLVRLIDAVLVEGHDIRVFHAGLIEGVRRLLVLATLPKPAGILGLTSDHESRLASLAARFDTDTLLRIFSVLTGLEAPLRYSEQPRFLLEAAAIRLASIRDLAPIEDLIARFEDGGEEGPRPGPAGSATAPGGSPAGRGKAPVGRGAPPGRPQSGPRTRSESAGEKIESASGSNASRSDRTPKADSAFAQSGTEGPPGSARVHPSAAGSPIGRDSSSLAHRVSGRRERVETTPPDSGSGREEPSGLREGSEGSVGAPVPGGSGQESGGGAEAAVADWTRERSALLDRVRERKLTLAMLLEQAGSSRLENGPGGEKLVFTFGEGQAFAHKTVGQGANLEILTEEARAALGRAVTVEVRRSSGESPAAPARPTVAGAPGLRETRPGTEARSVESDPFGGAEPAGEETEFEIGAWAPASGETRGDGARADSSRSGPGSASRTENAVEAGPGAGSPAVDPSGSTRPGGAPSPPARAGGVAKHSKLLAEALEDPVVKKVVERFGARIVDVKEVQ